ncbi:MAG TPA: hypothetical protein VII97_04850 [Anaerolineales bacterium]
MRERIESIVLGILFGALGAWQAMAGLGLIKMNISGMRDPGLVASGLMFFFAGALSFFKGTLGQTGKTGYNSPSLRQRSISWKTKKQAFAVCPSTSGS